METQTSENIELTENNQAEVLVDNQNDGIYCFMFNIIILIYRKRGFFS